MWKSLKVGIKAASAYSWQSPGFPPAEGKDARGSMPRIVTCLVLKDEEEQEEQEEEQDMGEQHLALCPPAAVI